MYEALGDAWREYGPSEIEGSLLEAVDDLSRGPRRVGDLQVDRSARGQVLALGRQAEAIRTVMVGGDEVAYSPFFAFERPAVAAHEVIQFAGIVSGLPAIGGNGAQVHNAYPRDHGRRGGRLRRRVRLRGTHHDCSRAAGQPLVERPAASGLTRRRCRLRLSRRCR